MHSRRTIDNLSVAKILKIDQAYGALTRDQAAKRFAIGSGTIASIWYRTAPRAARLLPKRKLISESWLGESAGLGRKGSPEYRAWQAMLQRCQPYWKHRHNYFDRGIRVCKRWRRFENFLADVGRKPTPQHSLDRKNNDSGYRPGNVRWATPREQTLNTRVATYVTFRRQRRHVSEWARDLGLTSNALHIRLKLWPLKMAMTHPRYCRDHQKRKYK